VQNYIEGLKLFALQVVWIAPQTTWSLSFNGLTWTHLDSVEMTFMWMIIFADPVLPVLRLCSASLSTHVEPPNRC